MHVYTIEGSSKSQISSRKNMVISLMHILTRRLHTEKDHCTAENILITLCEHTNSFMRWWSINQDIVR